MENKFYTIDQVAEILDMHHKTVRKFIKDGKLKANKVGKQWRISQSDLDKLLLEDNSTVESENHEIEVSSSYENNNKIRVSSVVELDTINKDEYMRISNTLLAIMNCPDKKVSGYSINIKYIQDEKKLRIMLWADLEITKDILDVIAVLTEKESVAEE